ncbi:MAG: ATP-grasp domain-containing protein [Chloroflexota bacterium]|nr:ATP-grasp domain-containing protein [Chloroflexota bacterium]MDQ5864175.1 ATP-grasp domain-containing protein [Chloroflexota bacterium]
MGGLMVFRKILIANRGEIAVRIARACLALDIKSVAVYSDADERALHVRACDEAYHIGPAPALESYLRGDKLIEVAKRAGCDAVHPGYGFLSENAAFARAVMDAGLTWIGPTPEAITLMGSKIEAKRLAEQAGVPVVPGYYGDDQSPRRLEAEAERVGYPVLIKASAGGGGKGMRVVEKPGDFLRELEGAQREALAAFNDSSVMLERYLTEPRHIEVQVLGDHYGNLIHLGERECSIQRRHQKVVEESPSPVVSEALRAQITGAALKLARRAGYTNAGTVEFIFQDGEFYFLEMNTRLQVEHPVTEQALNFDLVEAQIRIAGGERLWVAQDEIEYEGHAIEARLYAEAPEKGFLPATGRVTLLNAPYDGYGIRVDAGVAEGDEISPYYDPMIAKIVASGESRHQALTRMQEMLGSLRLEGVQTNLDFLRWLFSHPQFELGNTSTRFIERYYRPGAFTLVPTQVVLAAGALLMLTRSDETGSLWASNSWRQARQAMRAAVEIEGRAYCVELSTLDGVVNGYRARVVQGDESLFEGPAVIALPQPSTSQLDVSGVGATVRVRLRDDGPLFMLECGFSDTTDEAYLYWEGREYWVRRAPALSTERLTKALHLNDEDNLESPMPGKVLKVLVAAGDSVTEEQPLVIIEAMKMEFTVRAPHTGKVASVLFPEGAQVAAGDILVELEK